MPKVQAQFPTSWLSSGVLNSRVNAYPPRANTARTVTGIHRRTWEGDPFTRRAPTTVVAAMRPRYAAPRSGIVSNVGTSWTKWITTIPNNAMIADARSITSEAGNDAWPTERCSLGSIWGDGCSRVSTSMDISSESFHIDGLA